MTDLGRRSATRWLRGAALAATGVVVLATYGHSRDTAGVRPPAGDNAGCADRDNASATLSHFLCLPPSDLSSAAFRRYYLELFSFLNAVPPVPARDAPKPAWDQYDAAVAKAFAPRLAQTLQQYPVNVEDTRIAGVHVGVISPKAGVAAENRHRILINLHGGGFFANRGLTFGQLEAIPVAAIGRIQIVTIDYRQAPFYTYPAASEDVEAVYRELLKQHRAESIGIFGCSAGGVLAAQSVSWFQSRGLPRPGAVGIFCSGPKPNWSPAEGDSRIWGSSPPAAVAGQQRKLLPEEWYMETADRNDPQAYPSSVDAVVRRFPPTLFVNGTRDFTLSAAIAAHAQWIRLDVDASLYVIEGAPHAAHFMAIGTPEALAANTYIARWFSRHLAPARASQTQ